MKKFKKYLIENTREEYYEEQHKRWVDTPYQKSPVAVGWLDGKQNQAKRFETLLNIGVQEGDSILDLGCGLGHMVEHLKKIGLNVRYTGIDTNKNSIQQAYQFREATYIYGTIFDIQDRYDWGLASGVFNVEFPKLDMLETINELLSKANKGVAFNLLSNSANNNLTYENYIPKEIISHLKGDISIVENYGVENDFTIYIKKN
jgi:cyclopropane fatty-acyl-phospholipid synthase-like methyltransferase